MLATRRTGVQVDLEGTIHSDDPEDIVGKGDGVGLRGGVVSVGKLFKTMMAQLTHQRKTSGSRVEGRVEQDESRREESDEGTCDVTVDRKPAVGLPEEKEGRTKPADRGSVAVLERRGVTASTQAHLLLSMRSRHCLVNRAESP